MDSARCRLAASEVNGIVMNEEELRLLTKEYWKWLRALSDLLDIKIEKSKGTGDVGVVV